MPLPAWFAAMVQVPNVSIVRLPPDEIEQTVGVIVEKDTANPEVAVAVTVRGVALNVCVPGLLNVIVWLACPPTVNVKDCITEPAALVAVNVMGNVPAVVGVPVNAPPVNVTPEGRAPDSVIVGVGLPVAEGVNVLLAPVVKVTLAGLVNTGALLRLRVKVAVIGASVGTVVAPQVPSASTAIVETLFRLITYEALVALACGARLKVASNWFAAAATGAEPVPPKSATMGGLLIARGV